MKFYYSFKVHLHILLCNSYRRNTNNHVASSYLSVSMYKSYEKGRYPKRPIVDCRSPTHAWTSPLNMFSKFKFEKKAKKKKRKKSVFIFHRAQTCTPSSFATLNHFGKDFMSTMDIVKILYNMLKSLMWMGFRIVCGIHLHSSFQL